MGLFFKRKKSEPGQPAYFVRSFPFYIKAPLIIIGIYLFFNILFLLRDILVPFAFAGLIAILLNPIYNRLQKWKVPKIIAITLTILIAVLLVAGLLFFLSAQIAQFGEMLPQLKEKSLVVFQQIQLWLSAQFGLSFEKQMSMISEAANSGKAYIGQTLNTVLGMISVLVLIPIYVFLFLFYKPLILNFFYEVFDDENSEQVADILQETKSAVQSYIVGLMIEMVIIAVLNSVALLIIGVPYAILLGVIGAILNLVPYIGGVVAILLPVLMVTITKEGFTTQLLVVGAYAVIQFIDNNLIVPRVVSSKVSVNALISILVVLLGGAIWGLSGMFLSIPFVAVLKIIFDHIEELRPWGKILGDKMPEHPPLKVVNPEETDDE
jgi:predicted PurR-regulated permease PerM